MRPHGLMFHHFCDGRHPAGQGAMTGDELLKLIAFVGRHNILPAQEWYWRASSGLLRAHQICLTFDDGLRCQYDVALPILRANGLTAFWFVYTSVIEGNVEPLEIYRYFRTTSFASVEVFYRAFFASLAKSELADEVEVGMLGFDPHQYLADFPFYTDVDRRFRFVRDEVLGPDRYHTAMERIMRETGFNVRQAARDLWMTSAMLRNMHEEGHVIGLHSHTHPTRLGRMTSDEQWCEYKQNFDSIHRITGDAPRAMSHPCNSYNPDTLETLRKLGIRVGFRANLAQPDGCELEIPREDHANIRTRMRTTEAA